MIVIVMTWILATVPVAWCLVGAGMAWALGAAIARCESETRHPPMPLMPQPPDAAVHSA